MDVAVRDRDLLQRFPSQRTGVVGAKQGPRRPRREGDVEQRLMALALVQSRRAASSPNWFAYAPHRAAAVLVDESPPQRDDPGGISPDLLHVEEADSLAIPPQLTLQQLDLRWPDRDQRRFACLKRIPQKRDRARQVLVVALVDQGLVLETGAFHGLWISFLVFPAPLACLPYSCSFKTGLGDLCDG